MKAAQACIALSQSSRGRNQCSALQLSWCKLPIFIFFPICGQPAVESCAWPLASGLINFQFYVRRRPGGGRCYRHRWTINGGCSLPCCYAAHCTKCTSMLCSLLLSTTSMLSTINGTDCNQLKPSPGSNVKPLYFRRRRTADEKLEIRNRQSVFDQGRDKKIFNGRIGVKYVHSSSSSEKSGIMKEMFGEPDHL